MSAPTEAALLEALKTVVDPNTGKDLVGTKLIKNLRMEGGDVSFEVPLGYPAKSQIAALARADPLLAPFPGSATSAPRSAGRSHRMRCSAA